VPADPRFTLDEIYVLSRVCYTQGRFYSCDPGANDQSRLVHVDLAAL
jgi:hypothetical protein